MEPAEPAPSAPSSLSMQRQHSPWSRRTTNTKGVSGFSTDLMEPRSFWAMGSRGRIWAVRRSSVLYWSCVRRPSTLAMCSEPSTRRTSIASLEAPISSWSAWPAAARSATLPRAIAASAFICGTLMTHSGLAAAAPCTVNSTFAMTRNLTTCSVLSRSSALRWIKSDSSPGISRSAQMPVESSWLSGSCGWLSRHASFTFSRMCE
mmetsp:Transcript_8240/g.34600  ORF Transcript_8240/g.34600 Transcript_8240/m.34600 type:complete len:205 (+) Transcript_8240:1658-2272(+)